MAVWTENEVYLGYTSLEFVKIITTEKLKELLNLSSAATLTIHNVEYTGHPLELAVLLNYCMTCNAIKKIYLAIYNEDTKQWVYQDFALDVTIDTFLIPHFIYSAMPELILQDKHRIYYYYHNFTDTGVVQTPTEFGNLSSLSHNSIIHDVFIGEVFSFCKDYSKFLRHLPYENITICIYYNIWCFDKGAVLPPKMDIFKILLTLTRISQSKIANSSYFFFRGSFWSVSRYMCNWHFQCRR